LTAPGAHGYRCAVAGESKDGKAGARERTSDAFGLVEDAFYVAISLALMGAGVILFGTILYSFSTKLGDGPVSQGILELLDGLLLVFIITELVHTIRAVIDEKVLLAEPFLIVGIVAAIRRLVVISAEAKTLLGTPEFVHALFEIGTLAVAVVVFALAIFLLRKTTHGEPRPSHEPE
jgi:hypothetical protein